MGSPRKRSKTAPRPPTKPKRVGRGASSYVHFEGLLSPAQLERARAFTASEPVQDALEKAELFNGPGASRDRKSRVAWLDRAGHSDEDSERAIYPTWLHNRLRDCAREVTARPHTWVPDAASLSPPDGVALRRTTSWETSGARLAGTATADGRRDTNRCSMRCATSADPMLVPLG